MRALLYGRPKLRLTGLGPHNDSLICKLIRVCNWPCIETAGALNSKKSPPLSAFSFSFFLYEYCSVRMSRIAAERLDCCAGHAGLKGKTKGRKEGNEDSGRRRNGHLDSHLGGLWCEEVRLIGFPVHTRGHRELICVTRSALRSAGEKE